VVSLGTKLFFRKTQKSTTIFGSVANLMFSFFYFSVAKGLQPLCYGKIALHL
jgi:hypothetical protein